MANPEGERGQFGVLDSSRLSLKGLAQMAANKTEIIPCSPESSLSHLDTIVRSNSAKSKSHSGCRSITVAGSSLSAAECGGNCLSPIGRRTEATTKFQLA